MKLTEFFLDLLYPPKCVFCGSLLDRREKKTVCPDCRHELVIRRKGFGLPTEGSCVSICFAPLQYENTVRDSLRRYKFEGKQFYASTYAEIICKAFNNGELDCDIITWVPLAKGRLWKRGYDQAKLLAEELSRRTGIPCRQTLVKRKNIRPQSSMKSAGDRIKNIRNVYRPADNCSLQGKKVLLVDDIVTTGATLSEAASILKKCGATEIRAAAAARA